MKIDFRLVNDERGAALIISIMLLAVLLVVSMGLVNMTRTDVQISSNYKFYNEAFYNADEGVEMSPGVVIRTIVNFPNLYSYDVSAGYVADQDDDNGNGMMDFIDEIMGVSDYDPDEASTDPDISYTNSSGHDVYIDIDRTGAAPFPGASLEFASRYEGIGGGGSGGVMISFRIDSVGNGGSNSVCNIQATFRCVDRVGGCLE